MIELNQLEQLIYIAENKTISKAAKELLISQPALSRSMQRLESDLGVELFDHYKNKIVLNTTFDNLKTVNIARANYIGNSLLKDTMFNSLIDIFVDNIYDHQGW